VFVGKAGSVQPVAVVDAAAPGGGIFSYFRGPAALNDSGQVAFTAGRNLGSSSSDGVFVGTSGALHAVALHDTAAPGGGNYAGFRDPVLNSAGQVAFSAVLGATLTDGLFIGTPESVQTIALGSTAAPTGGNFREDGLPFSPEIDGSGRVAFWAILTGATSNQGLFAGYPGSIQMVALQGTPAPSGQTYANFSSKRLNLDANGEVSFDAGLTGSEAIVLGQPDALQTLVKLGDAAPLGGNFSSFGNPLVDESGQVVFFAGLTGFGVTPLNRLGLYTWSNGRLMKVVREGDQINVDPGPGMDLRIVSKSGIRLHESSGGEDGRASSFSRNGYLTYRLTFTDNTSGIFLRRLVELLGDFDGNGTVNAADYDVWKAKYGSTTSPFADANHDNIIDTADYVLWRDNFGQTVVGTPGEGWSTQISAPEPGTGMLLFLSIVSLLAAVEARGNHRRHAP
jgi:hypothetical protein